MIRLIDIQIWRFSFAVSIEMSPATAVLLAVLLIAFLAWWFGG